MTAYLLAERLWISTHEGSIVRYHRTSETGIRPVRLFVDPTKVEEERVHRERVARTDRIPFLYGSSREDWTSLGPHPLFDWLLETGLEPLPSLEPSQREWVEWWKRQNNEMTEFQRDKIWEALDRVRFFEVIEEEI